VFRRLLCSWIWSSAEDHTYGTGCITQSSWFFHFHLTKLVRWKCFVPQLYQFWRGISGGPAHKCFFMIHRGGRIVALKWQQVCYSVLYCPAVRVTVSCIVVQYSTLPQVTTRCNTLWHNKTRYLVRVCRLASAFCNTLQHTATHCNTLQHTATHCNTLQHAAPWPHCNTGAV